MKIWRQNIKKNTKNGSAKLLKIYFLGLKVCYEPKNVNIAHCGTVLKILGISRFGPAALA